MPTSTTRTLALKRFASFTPVLFALMVFAVAPVRAPAQTTAFTYQGQLTEAGTGANGNYDMQFTLFDIAAGGVQIGPAQAVPTVPVSNGLFTVQLDFGVNAFPGANRFVEIGVRPTGGSGFQTLAPRQQISSTPYAIRTLSAATADALSSTCTGCVQDTQIQSVAGSKVSGTIPVASVPAGSGNYIQNRTTEQPSASFNIAGNGRIAGNLTVDGALNGNGGNFIQNRTTPQAGANFNIGGNGTVAGTLSAGSLGIGTTSPAATAHVAGSMRWGGTGAAPPYVYSDEDGSGLFLEQVGTTPANSRMRLQSSVSGGQSAYAQFFIDPANGFSFVSSGAANGNVGIGTAAPQAKLDIRGDVKLGGSGQFFAPGGAENLRIVRGVISGAGGVIAGSGFQVMRRSMGQYQITFSPAFAERPAVTAMSEYAGVPSFVMTNNLGFQATDLIVFGEADGIPRDDDLSFMAIGRR
jgi:hypothetical protein